MRAVEKWQAEVQQSKEQEKAALIDERFAAYVRLFLMMTSWLTLCTLALCLVYGKRGGTANLLECRKVSWITCMV